MKEVLITGANGFIGKHVTKELTLRGYNPILFDMTLNPEQDIVNSYPLLEELISISDAVIHLAAKTGLDNCYKDPLGAVETNILGTANVLEACRHSDVEKVLIASTWAVNGNKVNPYDITKSTMEELAHSYQKLYGVPTVVFRLGTAYGPGMSPKGVIPQFIEKSRSGEPLVINGRKPVLRQFTWVEDIARAFRSGLKNARVEARYYSIVDPRVITIEDLAHMFSDNIVYADERPAEDSYQVLSSERAEKDLQWKPQMTLEEGIRILCQQ